MRRPLGNLKTDLQRYVSGVQLFLLVSTHLVIPPRRPTTYKISAYGLQNLMLYPAEYGALTQLWAGTMPEVLDHNGDVGVAARFAWNRETNSVC